MASGGGRKRDKGRGLTLAAAALATVPVLVATARAVAGGWMPSSDAGVIAVRAFDVLSDHPPLVGQYTQTSPLIGEPTYSLGPLLYWLLAVPAHIAPAALVVTMGAVSAACVAGSVLLAERRGGPGLAVVVAGALIVACRSLPVEVPYEIWNAWSGVFPFTLLLFVAWSVACGDRALLPLLALTASFIAQAHLTYVVPALLVVAVAVVGLMRWRRRQADPGVRRWAIAAVAVALVCWSAPIVDQLTREPGNLGQVLRLATDDRQTAGLESGLVTTARTIGIPPWWARSARGHPDRVLEVTRVPVLMGVTAVLVVGGLLAALFGGVRRRQLDVAAAAALALALCLSVTLVSAGIPLGTLGFTAVGYVLVWTSPAGMWVWLTLVWSAWRLLRPQGAAVRLPRPALAWGALGAATALAVAVAAGRDYDAPDRLPPGVKDYDLIRSTTARVAEAVAGSDGILIDAPRAVRNSLTFQSAIAYELRCAGLRLSVPARLVKEFGRQYGPDERGYEHVIRIRDAGAPAGRDDRVVVRTRHVAVFVSRGR
jgi:hypothetical protein